MMKLVVLLALVSVALAVQKRQIAATAKPGPQIKILRLESDVSPDGTYHWAYETENGISADESGQLKGTGEEAGTAAQGGFKYTSPEGVPVQIQYAADDNGFQPIGDVIPTPPPIPDAIVRALKYNEANPEPQELNTQRSAYNPVGIYSLG